MSGQLETIRHQSYTVQASCFQYNYLKLLNAVKRMPSSEEYEQYTKIVPYFSRKWGSTLPAAFPVSQRATFFSRTLQEPSFDFSAWAIKSEVCREFYRDEEICTVYN